MTQVLADLYSIICLKEQEAHGEFLSVPSTATDTLALLQTLVVCNSITLDARRASEWDIPNFCARFDDLFHLADLGDLRDPRIFEGVRRQSGKVDADPFLLAGLTYLRVAGDMGAYLLVHPTRREFLSELALPIKTSAAEVAINELEREIAATPAVRYASVDFAVPPVAEQVLFLHREHGLDIASAINELRDSKHARSFRRYCARIDGELAELSPRASVRPLQRLVTEIRSVVGVWKDDLDEGVRHVTRTLGLRKLWGLGRTLEALGLDAFTFRDPVLFAPRKSHLLFLNELYRGSRRPRSNKSPQPTRARRPHG